MNKNQIKLNNMCVAKTIQKRFEALPAQPKPIHGFEHLFIFNREKTKVISLHHPNNLSSLRIPNYEKCASNDEMQLIQSLREFEQTGVPTEDAVRAFCAQISGKKPVNAKVHQIRYWPPSPLLVKLHTELFKARIIKGKPALRRGNHLSPAHGQFAILLLNGILWDWLKSKENYTQPNVMSHPSLKSQTIMGPRGKNGEYDYNATKDNSSSNYLEKLSNFEKSRIVQDDKTLQKTNNAFYTVQHKRTRVVNLPKPKGPLGAFKGPQEAFKSS